MGRIIWGFLLTASLTAVTATAQVAYYPGTNVPAPNGVQAGVFVAPQLQAGHIALAGSGTPPGAPIQQGANDSRNGSGYDWIPGAVTNTDALRDQANAQATLAPGQLSADQNAPAAPMQTGIRNFEAAPAPGTRSAAASLPANMTLADMARKIKAHPASKQFTNQDIEAMNNGASRSQLGSQPGTQPNATVASASQPAADSQLAAANSQPVSSQPVIDPRELAKVNSALARHTSAADQGTMMAQNSAPPAPQNAPQNAQSPNAAMPQSDRASDEPSAQSSSDSAQPQPSTSAAPANQPAQQRLPQSSTSLPLLLGLGFVAVTAGTIWKLRS